MPVCERGHYYTEQACRTCPATGRRPGRRRGQHRGLAHVPADRGVRIIDVPRTYERLVGRSVLAGWAIKLIVVAAFLVPAVTAVVPVVTALLVRFLVPFLIVYVIFRMVFPQRSASPRRGLVSPMGFAAWRGVLGPPRTRGTGHAVVTTFAGERGGRRRGYELSSRSAPMVEHGDVVQIFGVPLAGRVQVLMMRSPSGVMFRRGLLGRACGVVAVVSVLGWLVSV